MLGTRIKARLSYANVMATLALAGLLAGGTALALPGKHRVTADDLHKNSVRASAIATGAVRTAEIKDGAVGGAEVADGSIGAADVADHSIAYQDLGSNSVIARIRNTSATASGDGGFMNPVNVPLSGATWTQGANETDVFFGSVTFTAPPTCGGSGNLVVALFVDGKDVDDSGYSNPPGTTLTTEFAIRRAYLFEPGSARPRTAEIKISDSCTGPGQNFTLDSVGVDAIAMR